MLKYKNVFTIYFLLFCVLTFVGCATVPSAGAGMPVYSINGVSYYPLLSLCQAKGVVLDYDTLTHSAVLSKGADKINLMLGERMILVNGEPRQLAYPVDIYRGTPVVPLKLAEILDSFLSKETYSMQQPQARGIRRIVIDPGHGGSDPGAIGRAGLKEKEVNFDIAKRLADILRDQGIEVILTRSADVSVSLERRVEIANQAKADFFISIHANANRARRLSGFEVYYLAPRADSDKRLFFAVDNVELELENAHFASSDANLKAILWDMIYTHNRTESVRLSQAVCDSIGSSLNTKVIGVKNAGFYVLKGIHIPGVLIEAGFLSNVNEERLLKEGYYRQQIAEAVARGVNDYDRRYAKAGGLN